MNTLRLILVFAFAGAFITACNKTTYRKTKGGMPYQVYRGDDTTAIKPGNYIKVSFTRKIKDSVYFSTAGTLPVYIQVPAEPQPYDISELWTSLRVGDSVVANQVIDTFMKRNPGQIPPQFKKGDKITYYLKILGVFENDSLARADYEKNNNAWLQKEITTIEQFLASKNIQAQKTPSGAFVQIINPGTGNLIDSGKYVTVNYTGTSWSGKKFDSNIDSSFGHVGPMPFIVGTGGMIKGFDEAAKFLRKGAKARIYIPSVLGYAGQPGSPNIKPYENLIFDVEVLDVQDKAPNMPDLRGQMENIDAPQPHN
jgi:FKBP-type peptidyl-prolyl cis-trans isomerase FkpA